jgi:hypothetical protein
MSSRLATLAAASCLAALLGLWTACSSPPSAASGAALGGSDWSPYGGPVSDKTPLLLTQLIEDPQAYDGTRFVLEAQVAEVCPVKGCWMTFDTGTSELRVTFQDYAFFVPKDIAGRTVRIEGLFSIREVPVAELQHYLEDAGRSAEAAAVTAPRMGYQLVATGVALRSKQ